MLPLIFYALLTQSCTNAQYSSTCSTTGSVRLYNTVTDVEGEGAVQICYSGTWYGVCDYSWNCADANVVCRQLGYTSGAGYNAMNSSDQFGYWPSVRSYYYDCSGSESSLTLCTSHSAPVDECYPQDNGAGVVCARQVNTIDCSQNGAVQLTNGRTREEGIVEYCYNGQWTPFCQFDDEEATVTCKQLGYAPYGTIIYDDPFNNGYSLISSISCSTYATENNLQSCSITPRGSTSSSSCAPVCSSAVAIRCYDYGHCTDGDVRLVDGAIYQEGRIEICVNGVWGSICGDGWSNNTSASAFVVCKQLGLVNSVPDLSRTTKYGISDRPVVYYGISCYGWERSIAECTRTEYLHFTCSSTYTAGVLCTDGCYDDTVRLVGSSDSEGTVEVCINNLWGLIGDAGWNNADAVVVCRQLGLPTGGAKAVFGSTKTNHTIHYSYVLCEGQELQLQDCYKISFSLDDGSAIYDEATVAGVVCAEATEAPLIINSLAVDITLAVISVIFVVAVICVVVVFMIWNYKRHPSLKRCPSIKCPSVKHPSIKCPSIKCPPVKCAPVKCPPVKCPSVKCPSLNCLSVRRPSNDTDDRPRSSTSTDHHSDGFPDHLSLHSSDEETNQDDEEVPVATEDRSVTKEVVDNVYQIPEDEENAYEDTA